MCGGVPCQRREGRAFEQFRALRRIERADAGGRFDGAKQPHCARYSPVIGKAQRNAIVNEVVDFGMLGNEEAERVEPVAALGGGGDIEVAIGLHLPVIPWNPRQEENRKGNRRGKAGDRDGEAGKGQVEIGCEQAAGKK